MAEQGVPQDTEADLRGKLIKRLAVAGLMVLALLGILAFLDYLAAPEEPEGKVYSKPVPVPPRKEVTQPVKPVSLPDPPEADKKAEKPSEEKAAGEGEKKPEPEQKPAVEKKEAAPELKAGPKQDATPKATPSAVPPSPVLRPAPRPVIPARPGGSAVTAAPTAPAAALKPEATPTVQPVPPRSSTTTLASVTTTTQPVRVVPPPPTLPRLLSGYVVQAGVFNSAQAAEALHAKLAINGIPSTLEARVQVGPFRTREEAEAAREKMKALGIDPVLIPPARR